MKRFITRYKTNKLLLELGWVLTVMGILHLILFFCTKDWGKDLDNVSWIEIILIFPLILDALIYAFVETIRIFGLSLGLSCVIGGVTSLVLTFPYRKRFKEIKTLRRQNCGKLPDDFLMEMYQSGELNKVEYEKEIENNLKLSKEEKSGDTQKDVNNYVKLNSRRKRRDMLLAFSIGVGSIVGAIILIPLLILLFVLLFIGVFWLMSLFY